jgi:hypothetical protein
MPFKLSKLVKLTLHLFSSISLIPKYFIEKKLTWSNIKSFFQGTVRLYNFNKEPSYIQEQFYFRVGSARMSCLRERKCLECGCTIPDLFLADKQCGGKCYPIMMEKSDWEVYKTVFDIQVDNRIKLGKMYIENNLDLIP